MEKNLAIIRPSIIQSDEQFLFGDQMLSALPRSLATAQVLKQLFNLIIIPKKLSLTQ